MKLKTQVSRPSLERLTVEQFFNSGKQFMDGDAYANKQNTTIDTVGVDASALDANARHCVDKTLYVINAKACDEFTVMNLINLWQAGRWTSAWGPYFHGVTYRDYASAIVELSTTPEERAEIEAAKAPAVQEWKNGDVCYHEEFDGELRFVGFACYDSTHAVIQCAGLLAGFHVVEIVKLTSSPNNEQLKTKFIKRLMAAHTPKQLAAIIYDMEQAK